MPEKLTPHQKKVLKTLEDNFKEIESIHDRLDELDKHVTELHDVLISILQYFKEIKEFESKFFKNK